LNKEIGRIPILGGAGATTATGLKENCRRAVSDGGLHRSDASDTARNPLPLKIVYPAFEEAPFNSDFNALAIATRGGATLRRKNTLARLATCNGAHRKAACAFIFTTKKSLNLTPHQQASSHSKP